MTPLELSVLIHYHVSTSAFKPESKVADEAVRMFVEKGLLKRDDRLFCTTEKGAFFIEHLLRTPFPETTYTISVPPFSACLTS